MSPRLLLLVTIVLANLISAVDIPPPDASSALLAIIASTQQNLILVQSMIISLVTLASASPLVRHQGKTPGRQALRAPFYAQCYLSVVFATLFALPANRSQYHQIRPARRRKIIC